MQSPPRPFDQRIGAVAALQRAAPLRLHVENRATSAVGRHPCRIRVERRTLRQRGIERRVVADCLAVAVPGQQARHGPKVATLPLEAAQQLRKGDLPLATDAEVGTRQFEDLLRKHGKSCAAEDHLRRADRAGVRGDVHGLDHGADGAALSINATAIRNQYIYAATNKGIYSAKLNSNLLDFNNWKLMSSYSKNKSKNIFVFNDKLYAVIDSLKRNYSNLYHIDTNNQFIRVSILPTHVYSESNIAENQLLYVTNDTNYVVDSNMNITASFKAENNDRVLGITMVNNAIYRVNNFSPVRSWSKNGTFLNSFKPQGPSDDNVFAMASGHGELWTIAGGYNGSYNNLFKYIEINRYDNGSWFSYNIYNSPSLKNAYDPVSIYLNPKEKGHAYISTWSFGLFEFNKNTPFKNYDNLNSPLEYRSADTNWLGVSSTVLDKDNNLWVVNTHVSKGLAVKKSNGIWQNFNFSPQVSDETRITEIEITKNGILWMALPRSNEILVFIFWFI